MKKKWIIINVLLLVGIYSTILAGCVPERNSQSPSPETLALTADELEYFNGNEFFNGDYMNIRNQFLSSHYDQPEKIDLFNLFYCGSGHDETLTEAEIAIVAPLDWNMEPICPCTKISRANMDALLTECMGLTLAETEKIGLDSFTYLEQYDAYYYCHGDTNYRMEISFSHGVREGNTICLFYDDWFMGTGETMLTLKEREGSFLFLSNKVVSQDQFAASTGDIHDYMPDLLAGRVVSGYDLLPCLENFTHETWAELDAVYGREWWNPFWKALHDAAVGGECSQRDYDEQPLRNYYLGKALLASDGAYSEGLLDIAMLQWKYDPALYSVSLSEYFSLEGEDILRRLLTCSLPSYTEDLFGLYITSASGAGGPLYLDAYPVDFPFFLNLEEKNRENFRAESFGPGAKVEGDDFQVTYLNPCEGVYTVITIRALREGCSVNRVAIGDLEEELLAAWQDKFLKKLDGISYDDEAWFGSQYDYAYAHTQKEGSKSVVFLIKGGIVYGIELINGLDGAVY